MQFFSEPFFSLESINFFFLPGTFLEQLHSLCAGMSDVLLLLLLLLGLGFNLNNPKPPKTHHPSQLVVCRYVRCVVVVGFRV
jgi:hypothetical protein